MFASSRVICDSCNKFQFLPILKCRIQLKLDELLTEEKQALLPCTSLNWFFVT